MSIAEQMHLLDTWQLGYPDGHDTVAAEGLRLSTDCPCRRLREFFAKTFDPDLYHSFPKHLDERGHGFEHVLADNLEREGHTFLREVVIPWEHGETHIDFVILSGPRLDVMNDGKPVVIEVKANSDGEHRAENRRQTERQIRVTERAVTRGETVTRDRDSNSVSMVDLLSYRWMALVIDPVTWQIAKPDGHSIILGDDRRAEIDAELSELDRYMTLAGGYAIADELHWEPSWPACKCSSCWPIPEHLLPAQIDSRAEVMLELEADFKAVQDEYQALRCEIKADLLRLDAAGKLGSSRKFKGKRTEITLTKTNAMRVRPRPAD